MMLHCVLMICLSCQNIYAQQQHAPSIKFKIYHYEYGEKVVGEGVNKVALQIRTDSYFLRYELFGKCLMVYKVIRGLTEDKEYLVYKTKLSETQKKFVKTTFKNTDFASLVDFSGVKVMIEDGFVVDVVVRQSGKEITIEWNNAYVKPLVVLFDLANDLSPEKYRTYKPSKKHEFMEMLRQNSQLGEP